MYRVEYDISKRVTEYNVKSGDWSGREFEVSVTDKTFDTVNSLGATDLDELVVNAFENVSLYPNVTELIFSEENGYFRYSITENGDGIEDENGTYLADYYLWVRVFDEEGEVSTKKFNTRAEFA